MTDVSAGLGTGRASVGTILDFAWTAGEFTATEAMAATTLTRSTAIDAIDTNLSLRSRRARLWPQTEWLKAALILSEEAEDDERQTLLDDSATALEALRLYLTDEGVWRDKRLPSGDFMDEPAPATSFYHILMAFSQLSETLGVLGMDGGEPLALD